jgi:hypothetical protein
LKRGTHTAKRRGDVVNENEKEQMRGPDGFTESMFRVLKMEDFVPEDRLLRPILPWPSDGLERVDDLFARMYEADEKGGKPSIAPEKLVRAMSLQVLG